MKHNGKQSTHASKSSHVDYFLLEKKLMILVSRYALEMASITFIIIIFALKKSS